MNLHFGQCWVGQLYFLTAGAAQRSRAGSRASEFTYLASDAGKTRDSHGLAKQGLLGHLFLSLCGCSTWSLQHGGFRGTRLFTNQF